MKYKFSCPLEGCESTMTVDAQNEEEAVAQLSAQAKEHLASTHPEIQKTDAEVSNDISSMMEKVEEEN